jgi:hypothetical protein
MLEVGIDNGDSKIKWRLGWMLEVRIDVGGWDGCW